MDTTATRHKHGDTNTTAKKTNVRFGFILFWVVFLGYRCRQGWGGWADWTLDWTGVLARKLEFRIGAHRYIG